MRRIIYNGRIYLGRENFCDALAIENGRITRTGSSGELLSGANGDEKINAGGALILPAFIDSHLHLMSLGKRAGEIEGSGAKSIEELINRGRKLIEKLKLPRGTYIQGSGVNPDLFTGAEKRDLLREDLDKISVEHPVIINRHCGHIAYCNSLALKMAGLSESSPEVNGGIVEKDENGRPIGIFRENAKDIIYKPVPLPSREEMKTHLRLAMKKAHSLGISACGSNDSSGSDFDSIAGAYNEIFNESRDQGVPALRVTLQQGISSREDILDLVLQRDQAPLFKDPVWGTFLKPGPVKLFADGSLGGHTAWMSTPYKDKPDSRGCPVLDRETISRFIKKAHGKGVQVLIHAIGDEAMDACISAIEEVTVEGAFSAPDKNPLRHGIIHCQITSPRQLERMAARKILAIVQPIFLLDDIHILESRVGKELASTSYAWNSMQNLGVPVSYSTDAPISPLDPLLNIEWAVLRRDSGDPASPAFSPGERVDVYTAVDAYTKASALVSFDEKSLGRIAPGYFADLTFLDRDIFSIPPDEIHKARILKTMCAGEIV